MRILSFLSSIFLLFFFGRNLDARPYYTATRGVSCSACHLNPAGGGVRKVSEGTPTFINDSIAIGADLRGAYSNDGNPLTDYSFKAFEQRFYLMAEPVQGISFAYSNESGSTAEAYGIVQKEEWLNAYLRFGKFFIPYGLQLSDPDHSAYIKTAPFAPKGVGFSLQPGLTDVGIEIGLSPKKVYFLNLAITNGNNKSGSGSAKSVTGRGGFLGRYLGLGLTGFQSTIPSHSGQEQLRYGAFGWGRIGSLAILGEVGQGSEIESSTQTRKNVEAVYAEINYMFGNIESTQNNLMLKGKFDYSRSDSQSSAKFRYTLGMEWFLKNHLSFEWQYRFLNEKPEIENSQTLFLSHLWF